MKKQLNGILASHTGKKANEIEKDSDRDNFMSSEEARDYGLIDEVIASMKDAGEKK